MDRELNKELAELNPCNIKTEKQKNKIIDIMDDFSKNEKDLIGLEKLRQKEMLNYLRGC